jgi:hypothetical protein
LPGSFEDVQNRILMQSGDALNRPDAHAFAKQMHHLAGLLEIHAQPVQWLLVGKCFSAAVALVTLDSEIFIRETTGLFHFV